MTSRGAKDSDTGQKERTGKLAENANDRQEVRRKIDRRKKKKVNNKSAAIDLWMT